MNALQQAQSNSVVDHFIGRLNEAETWWTPYPHTYITRAFPEDYYKELLANLPPDEKYTDRQFDNRMMVGTRELGGFWKEVGDWLLSKEVVGTLLDIFELQVPKLQADVRLVRDSAGYRIKPHTDIKAKLMSLLFYLATDEKHDEEGTTVMIPKQEGFTSDGSRRYEFVDFKNIYTAPFMPNTMLGFPRSNVSFHGVTGTTIPRRDVLLVNLYRTK